MTKDKTKAMEHQRWDNTVAAVSGIAGGGLYITLGKIDWQVLFNSLGSLLWLGFIALFSGAMGVLGKHLASKYLKRKNKKQ